MARMSNSERGWICAIRTLAGEGISTHFCAIGSISRRRIYPPQQSKRCGKPLEGVAAEQSLDTLRQEFLTPRYLSPVREESQRVVQTGSPPPRDVGQKGEFAIPHLAEILKDPEKKEAIDFISKYASLVAHV